MKGTRSIVLAAALAVAACAPPPESPPDTRTEDEAAIRALVREWAAAAQARDPEAFVSVYAEDGTLMLEDAPDIHGAQALREGIGAMMQDPNFNLSFEADEVVVSRSGDMAYEAGHYSLTVSDEAQQPATERGRYVVVWTKDADGAWKVAFDIPVSDPPE